MSLSPLHPHLWTTEKMRRNESRCKCRHSWGDCTRDSPRDFPWGIPQPKLQIALYCLPIITSLCTIQDHYNIPLFHTHIWLWHSSYPDVQSSVHNKKEQAAITAKVPCHDVNYSLDHDLLSDHTSYTLMDTLSIRHSDPATARTANWQLQQNLGCKAHM